MSHYRKEMKVRGIRRGKRRRGEREETKQEYIVGKVKESLKFIRRSGGGGFRVKFIFALAILYLIFILTCIIQYVLSITGVC